MQFRQGRHGLVSAPLSPADPAAGNEKEKSGGVSLQGAAA